MGLERPVSGFLCKSLIFLLFIVLSPAFGHMKRQHYDPGRGCRGKDCRGGRNATVKNGDGQARSTRLIKQKVKQEVSASEGEHRGNTV